MSDLADKVDEVVTSHINGPDWWVDDALPEAVIEVVLDDLLVKAIEASDAYAASDNDEMSDLWLDRVKWLELSKARALGTEHATVDPEDCTP